MAEPFYADGLSFSCTRCSNCCRHDPGFVFLSRIDITRLADGLGVTAETFVDEYCRSVDIGGFTRLSLNEKSNYDCIFWENGGCTVYEHRPLQCRSFPFWSSNLASREDWESLASFCPGINQGTLHPREEIESLLAQRLEEPLV